MDVFKLKTFTQEEIDKVLAELDVRTKQFEAELKILFLKHFESFRDCAELKPEFTTFIQVAAPPVYRAFGYGCQHCMVQAVRDWANHFGSHKEVKEREAGMLSSLSSDSVKH